MTRRDGTDDARERLASPVAPPHKTAPRSDDGKPRTRARHCRAVLSFHIHAGRSTVHRGTYGVGYSPQPQKGPPNPQPPAGFLRGFGRVGGAGAGGRARRGGEVVREGRTRTLVEGKTGSVTVPKRPVLVYPRRFSELQFTPHQMWSWQAPLARWLAPPLDAAADAWLARRGATRRRSRRSKSISY